MITSEKRKISIFVMNVIIFCFLFFNNVAPHTIFSKIFLFVFIIYSLLFIFFNKKIYINYYFILYIIFIAFILIINYFGLFVNSLVVNESIKTLLLNVLFLFGIYNYLKTYENLSSISTIYITSFLFSLIMIMFVNRNSLFTARLAHAWGENAVSYYFLGQPVSMSSNLIGFQCDVSLLLSLYKLYVKKEKKYLIYIIFFIFGLSLTGSRKAFIIFGIFIIFSIFYFSKNKELIMKIIKLFILFGIVYFAIMKIPYFYNMIGKRLQSLINYFSLSIVDEESVSMRNNLRMYALKMFYRKPFFGYGLGYFNLKYSNVVENTFLELLVGTGIYGTILYYLYTIPTFFYYIKYRKNSLILKILCIIMISILITEFGSSIYFERSYIMFVPVFIYTIMYEKKKNNNLLLISDKSKYESGVI